MSNFIILTDNPFPNGNAGSSRIRGYVKGFSENNQTISIIVFRPTHTNILLKNPSKGRWESNFYIYPGGKTIKSKYFINRRIENFNGYIFSYVYLIYKIFFNKTKTIIFYGDYPIYERILLMTTKLLKVKMYKEINEHPKCVNSLKNTFKYNMYFGNLKLYTKLLIMTKSLISFFEANMIEIHKLLLINNFTISEIFDKNKNNLFNKQDEYIFISGSLKDSKDGIFSFLPIYIELLKTKVNLKLIIAAYGNKNQVHKINEFIRLNNLSKQIIFMGEVPSIQITDLILNAKLLILPRPKSFQVEFGFPTKLVEYVASKNPVISSNVGEIKNYFKDMENIILYNYENKEELLNKINWVFTNYNQALDIAEKGYLVVIKYFNPRIEVKKIIYN